MKIRSKEGPLLAPLPTVMVSCGTMEESNIITIAWSGIINSNPPMTYVSVQRSRHSHDIIAERGEFVINLTTTELAKAMDFCGVRSGRDIDKFEAAHLTREAADEVSAPMIAESPVNLECKVTEVKSFPSHDMFIAEIVAVHIDDKYVSDRGAYDYGSMDLVAFSHGKYYRLHSKELGFFGYSVMKPKTAKKRRKALKK
ncbi:MAG: flavin reductase family protein [Mogibacterium sp.]|nr:flavin reductase family protein [Mogibacterium sp.]MBR2540004.1 flavin reductase family protein [Mogibacterium sp.]